MYIESGNVRGVYDFINIIKCKGVHSLLYYTSLMQNDV